MIQTMIGIAVFLVVAPLLLLFVMPFAIWALFAHPWLFLVGLIGLFGCTLFADWLDNR